MRIDLHPPDTGGQRLCKIDYIAFTKPNLLLKDDPEATRWNIAYEEFANGALGRIEDEVSRACWELKKGRGFYKWMAYNHHHHIAVHWGGSNAHCYIECGGLACDRIREVGVLDEILQENLPRLSRIDFAVDLDIKDKPTDFVSERDNRRIKISGCHFSEDGDTVYVGSRNSERYARVYRYHPPHPRSDYLRVEHVFHASNAKLAASTYRDEGLASVVDRAGNTFGWSHPAWTGQVVVHTKLPAAKLDRQKGGTVRWLYTTVPQALLQSHEERLIDLHSWYNKFLRDVIEGERTPPP